MKLDFIQDVRGRFRLEFDPRDLGPEAFESLSEALLKSGEGRYVSFSRRTGSLLYVYQGGDAARGRALSIIAAFDPGERKPVSVFEDRVLITGDDTPEEANPVYGFVLRRLLLPRPVRLAVDLIMAIPYFVAAVKHFFWERELDVEVLDGAALAVCFGRGDYASAGTLIFFYSLSEYLEGWTVRRSMASLFKSLRGPEERIWVKGPDGGRIRVPESELSPGNLVIIQSGGLIPVDGVVEEGEAMVNQATMTGEPLPVRMTAGGAVYAGTTVEEGEITVKAARVGVNTRIRSIIEYIKESEASKSGLQGRVERLADSIVPFNFLLMFATYLITRDPAKAANALLVHYSCVIRLSTPVVVLSAMREGNETGFLVKGGRYLEELSEADVCVFDKTGTVTEARPRVTEVRVFSGQGNGNIDRDYALRLAACLEEHFPHPVGRAVVRKAKEEGLGHEDEMHAQVQYVAARGIASTVNGERAVLGSRLFIEEDEKISIPDEAEKVVSEALALGESMIFLGVGGVLAAVIVITDKIRFRAKETLSALKEQGVRRTIMLTGDLEGAAKNVSQKLGFDEYRSQLLPADKANVINALTEEGGRIMMVGDGLNDSAALSRAGVGVALSDGSALAKDVANVQLLNGRLDALPAARLLSRRAMRRTRENYRIIVGFNTLYIVLALAGVISSGLTSILHNATTIYVAFRGARPFLSPGERPVPLEKLPEEENPAPQGGAAGPGGSR
ncbi:MAG: heavy metal translocating P-type ATPase [Deltaproteobacteria bacterium]|jgi:Cu2+-exporting ATPase|nr:heavy metal translocating P-type ATPase [Deltaproteobacteria bacterium]